MAQLYPFVVTWRAVYPDTCEWYGPIRIVTYEDDWKLVIAAVMAASAECAHHAICRAHENQDDILAIESIDNMAECDVREYMSHGYRGIELVGTHSIICTDWGYWPWTSADNDTMRRLMRRDRVLTCCRDCAGTQILEAETPHE